MPFEVIMPALGMAQDTGRLVSWLKKVGEAVDESDVLMEVETDKTTMEVPAGASGFVSELFASAGDDVPVGNVIAIITNDKPAIGNASVAPIEHKKNVISSKSSITEQEAQILDLKKEISVSKIDLKKSVKEFIAPASVDSLTSDKVLASPKLRRLANESGYDLKRLRATGLQEPYHVSEIEQLKHLSVMTLDTPDTPAQSYMPSKSYLQAKVPSAQMDEFVERMSAEAGQKITLKSLWLSFASSSFQNAFNLAGFTVNIKNETGQFTDAYENPNLYGLASQQPLDEFQSPNLVIRDLTCSYMSNVNVSAISAAELCIHRTLNTYELSFAFNNTQFESEQALKFIDKFSKKLANPLLGLI